MNDTPKRIPSTIKHGTWDNPAPLYQVDVPRMPKPDFSGWVPSPLPDGRLPGEVWQEESCAHD